MPFHTVFPRSVDPFYMETYYINGSRILGHTVIMSELKISCYYGEKSKKINNETDHNFYLFPWRGGDYFKSEVTFCGGPGL